MAGFRLRGHLLGAQNPAQTEVIIDNEEVMTIGDAITMVAGFAVPCGADDRIFGIVTGIITNAGIDLDSCDADDYDGTWVSSTNTYTAAANNETVKKVKVRVIADPYALFYNDANGTLTQAMEFLHFSLTDEDQIAYDSSSATVGEMQLWKRDPDGDADLSKGLFRITSWQGDSFEPETA